MTEDVKSLVKKAILKLTKLDSMLFDYDVNERSISHKLAEYLQVEFRGWNVDCEYNREGNLPKRRSPEPTSSDDTEGRTIYPDIIIHKRGIDQNKLVIEIKKANNSKTEIQKDRSKIEDLVSNKGYEGGVLVIFDFSAMKAVGEWYENGEWGEKSTYALSNGQ